jgi:hypothetical protein
MSGGIFQTNKSNIFNGLQLRGEITVFLAIRSATFFPWLSRRYDENTASCKRKGFLDKYRKNGFVMNWYRTGDSGKWIKEERIPGKSYT